VENLEDLALPAVLLFGGLIILGIGLFKSSRARGIARWQRTAAGSLKEGGEQMVTGKARSAVTVSSPVTQTPCTFYLETVEEHYSGRSSGWSIIDQKPYGGFYLDDGSGSALVLPGAGCLDLVKPEITGASDGLPMDTYARATRRKEQFIVAGEDVTVIGTPVPLGNLMAVLRSGVGIQMPAELMTELLNIEKEKGPVGMLCFIPGGLRAVSDASYEDYVSNAKASYSLYLQLGGLISILSLARFLYVLKAVYANGLLG
jgi:hypothetical protein